MTAKRWLPLAVLVGLIALAVFVPWGEGDPLTDGASAHADASSGSDRAGVAAKDDATKVPARTPMSKSDAAATGEGSSDRVVLTGRCVDLQKRPIAGIRIGLRVHLADMDAYDTHRAAQWRPPPATTTDAMGRFELRTEDPGLYLELAPEAPNVVASHSWIDLTDAEEVGAVRRLDLHDVTLVSGHPVRGTVVNHLGQPLPRGVFQLGDEAAARVRDGAFDFGHLAAGRYYVEMPVGGKVVTPGMVYVGSGRDTTALRVVVNEPPRVRGIVVDDASGEPVSGFLLFHDTGEAGVVMTDAKGRFEIQADSLWPPHLKLYERAFDPDERHPMIRGRRVWNAFPTEPIEVRIGAWPELRLRVRALGGDELPPHFFVVASGADPTITSQSSDGVSVVVGLRTEPGRIRAMSEDRRWLSDWVAFDASHFDANPLDVTLRPATRLRVRISNPGSPPKPATFELSENGSTVSSVEGLETTTAELFGPTRLRGLKVEVSLGRIGRRVELTEEHEKHRTVVVELPTVIPDRGELEYRHKGVELPYEMVTAFLGLRRVGATSFEQSEFSAAAGEYQVIANAPVEAWTPERGDHEAGGTQRVLANVTVKGGKTTVVEIDAEELRTGRLRGVLTHEGAPLPDVVIQWTSANGRFEQKALTDAFGRFVTDPMPHGEYFGRVIHFRRLGFAGERKLWLAGRVRVRAGKTTPCELKTSSATQRLRIVDATGRPLRAATLRVTRYGLVRTDADGRVELRPAPPGRLELIERVDDPKTRRTWIVERAARKPNAVQEVRPSR